MTRFKRAIRGYDKKQVDEYVSKMTAHNEGRLRELEECVERLKQENDYLYAKNSEYARNEERVSGAIMQAMELKQKLESEIKTKVALEEDRLNEFKRKWTEYARGIDRSNADRAVEDIEEYANELKEEFIKKASRDLNLKAEEDPAERSYKREAARVEKAKRRENASAEKLSAATIAYDKDRAERPSFDFAFDEE